MTASRFWTYAMGDRRYSLLFGKEWLAHTFHFLKRDIAQQFERTSLGFYWLLITQTVMIFGIGFVYSVVFNNDVSTYLPHLAISILTWNMVSATIGEGPRTYVSAGMVLHAFSVPMATFPLRTVLKYFATFLGGLPIFFAVAIFFDVPIFPTFLLAFIHVPIVLLILYPVCHTLGVIGARFRDISQTVQSIVFLFFLISPILYKPNLIGPNSFWLLILNPFYYILEFVREPFLGSVPPLFIYVAIAAMAILAWAIAIFVSRRYGRYVVFWVYL